MMAAFVGALVLVVAPVAIVMIYVRLEAGEWIWQMKPNQHYPTHGSRRRH